MLCVHPSPVCTACVASSPPLLAFDWDPPSSPLAISITLLTSPHQSSTDCVTFTHQSAFERLVKLACSVTLSNENVLLPLHTFKSSTAHARSLSRRRFFAPPTHPTVCFSLSPGPLCSLGYCPLAQLHLCPSWRRCQRRIPQVVGVSTSVVLQKCFLAPCFLLFSFSGGGAVLRHSLALWNTIAFSFPALSPFRYERDSATSAGSFCPAHRAIENDTPSDVFRFSTSCEPHPPETDPPRSFPGCMPPPGLCSSHSISEVSRGELRRSSTAHVNCYVSFCQTQRPSITS